MTDFSDDEAPRWLLRSDATQPFVVTVCSSVDLNQVLSRMQTLLGELLLESQQRLAENACDVTVVCNPVTAWSLFQSLRVELADADIYMQPLDTPRKRLLICDMDMTIVAAETLDEVAARLGMGERISAITTRAMHGEIDFDAALRERIAMLAGQPVQVFEEVAASVALNLGAAELLSTASASGVHTILISGGFAQVVEPLARQLGFDEFYCNHLDLEVGRLTGKVVEPIVNADFKCHILQQRAQALGFALRDCCAIGDGANDLPMLTAAELGIAYYGKPILRAATSCHIDVTDLKSAIHFMGLHRATDLSAHS
jgi:phosphoserine phosphatase